jgi:catechol 2,3-dioxygenase-like lactoylglutathione lyase family enzyme
MKIDHIAFIVKNPREVAQWYCEKFDANLLYADDTWSFIEFDNIKMAFTVEGHHPQHVAFEVPTLKKGKLHRDGSESVYQMDPFGMWIEYIKYPKDL